MDYTSQSLTPLYTHFSPPDETYRVITVRVHKRAPAALESSDHLLLLPAIGLDDLHALCCESLGLVGVAVAGNGAHGEGVGFVLEEGLDDASALSAGCAEDGDELW